MGQEWGRPFCTIMHVHNPPPPCLWSGGRAGGGGPGAGNPLAPPSSGVQPFQYVPEHRHTGRGVSRSVAHGGACQGKTRSRGTPTFRYLTFCCSALSCDTSCSRGANLALASSMQRRAFSTLQNRALTSPRSCIQHGTDMAAVRGTRRGTSGHGRPRPQGPRSSDSVCNTQAGGGGGAGRPAGLQDLIGGIVSFVSCSGSARPTVLWFLGGVSLRTLTDLGWRVHSHCQWTKSEGGMEYSA